MADETTFEAFDAFEAVWPLGPRAKIADAFSPRLDTLDGKVIAELWDYLYEGDRAFPILREALHARYPNATFVEYPVFGNIHGTDELEVVAQLPETLAEHGADAVLVGVGH